MDTYIRTWAVLLVRCCAHHPPSTIPIWSSSAAAQTRPVRIQMCPHLPLPPGAGRARGRAPDAQPLAPVHVRTAVADAVARDQHRHVPAVVSEGAGGVGCWHVERCHGARYPTSTLRVLSRSPCRPGIAPSCGPAPWQAPCLLADPEPSQPLCTRPLCRTAMSRQVPC